MGFLSRLFRGKHQNSKTVARERLRLVLTHDRSGIPPGLLSLMENDIIGALSRHVRVDREGAEISLAHSQGRTRLIADIPITRTRTARTPDSDE